MTIAPGALVMTRPTGTILWVVVAKADDGRRWRLRGGGASRLAVGNTTMVTKADRAEMEKGNDDG
jgi:hypothetical protein